ncbi:MAG: aldehyde ferredoxin oxidoreductase [Chitinivibrionales bacterium]|nr:aldehyde ferredoxin oxidoreductase [Chitinivibrionales bacterium]
MHGWHGKILRIDLSSRSTSVIEPDEAVYHTWIGGKGLAGHFLADAVTLPPDHPSMPLLLCTGPLVGTTSPTSGRMTIMSRSPLTGTIGDSSVGGNLGTAIKQAGWDGIIVVGRADGLCGIEVDDRECRVTDAEPLRGLPTHVARERLKDRGSVVVVGPAAENGVAFASIMVDRHFAAARNGLGLVLGAKNLKYITVKGSGRTAVHDPDELKRAREDIFRLTAASPILLGELGITNFGTGALYDLISTRRMMPTGNFRRTHFEHAREMNAYAYKTRYGTRKEGCRGCHVLCKKATSDGRAVPEFETMSHFSALIDNDDMDTVVRANELCNELGMDTITAASSIACYQEIEGTHLRPGDVLALLEDIGHARGAGAELARGSAAYAASRGRPELSMSVKGQELPAYDPRGAYGMALGYAVSTRGGCHLRAYPISHEILRKPVATDRFSFDGKARIVKIAEDMNAVVDSLTACKFIFFGASLEEYARAYTAVTGVPSSAQELLRAGERIYYHERMMNARNGFDATHDDLPRRFFEEDGSDGEGIHVGRLERDAFLRARANYYKVRGLDDNGCPTPEKAAELGLEWKTC